MDPLSLGLLGVGAAGSLFGMFKGSPKLERPNLARDNPELWAQLEELKAQREELDRLYDQRRQGATAGEIAGMAQARSEMGEKMGNLGLVGSSAGAQMMGGYDAKLIDGLYDRIFREQQALMQARQQAQGNYLNAYSGAYGNEASFLNGQAQAQAAEDMARNQFFGGLVNSGMSLYGNNQYLDAMKSMGPNPYLRRY